MKLTKKIISNLHDQEVSLFTLKNNNNFSITFSNLGGYIHKVQIPYLKNPELYEDVILGYENPLDVYTEKSYFNVITGRICNRIKDAQFSLNGKKYFLYKNDNSNHLHGGLKGFNTKIWKISDVIERNNDFTISMKYLSPHLEEGYPGNLSCTTSYNLNNNNEFSIKYSATTDQDTIVNITNHNYWNFHGHNKNYNNISDHSVMIDSDSLCEVDEELIPTGNIKLITGSKYDFINKRNITQYLLDKGGIDLNYVVNANKQLRLVGKIWSNITKMGVSYRTDQPGLQFYTGNNMFDRYQGKYGRSYGKNYGLCFESQQIPNSINQENFVSPILRIGERYLSTTIIKLHNDF